MISCDFFGGLGNNLFQLATVLSIQKKFGYDLRIPSVSNRGDIKKYGQSDTLEFSNLFDNEFIYDDSLNYNFKRYYHTDINPKFTDYTYKPFPIEDNLIYHGYFQSEKYFLGVDIKNELVLKNSNIEYIKDRYSHLLEKKNISLHCRLGGDRVTEKMQIFHKNVSSTYYEKALSLIQDYNQDEYNILVFTDNKSLCEKVLEPINKNFIFIDNNNDNVLDFTFMSLCNVNIVSNSTFSWWAAYMNKKLDKKVIATKSEWFGHGYQHFNLKDTFPEDWITL
jgi:hypothetical protein